MNDTPETIAQIPVQDGYPIRVILSKGSLMYRFCNPHTGNTLACWVAQTSARWTVNKPSGVHANYVYRATLREAHTTALENASEDSRRQKALDDAQWEHEEAERLFQAKAERERKELVAELRNDYRTRVRMLQDGHTLPECEGPGCGATCGCVCHVPVA